MRVRLPELHSRLRQDLRRRLVRRVDLLRRQLFQLGTPFSHVIPARIELRALAGGIEDAEVRRGIGPALLKDALIRTARAADIAGIRALIVHAKDDDARSFYRHFDFDESPTDPYHLMLIIKDLKKAIGEGV